MKKLLILLAILIFCFDCFKAMNEKQPNDTDIFLDATDNPADLKATQAEDRLRKDLGTVIKHQANKVKKVGLEKAKSLGANIQKGFQNIDREELVDQIALATAANLHEEDPNKIAIGAANTLIKGKIDQEREKLAEDDGRRVLDKFSYPNRTFKIDSQGTVQKGQKFKDEYEEFFVKDGWKLIEVDDLEFAEFKEKEDEKNNGNIENMSQHLNQENFWNKKKLVFYDPKHIAKRHRKNLMLDAANIMVGKLTGEETRSVDQAVKQETVKNFVGYMNERYGDDSRNNYGNNYNGYNNANYQQGNQFNPNENAYYGNYGQNFYGNNFPYRNGYPNSNHNNYNPYYTDNYNINSMNQNNNDAYNNNELRIKNYVNESDYNNELRFKNYVNKSNYNNEMNNQYSNQNLTMPNYHNNPYYNGPGNLNGNPMNYNQHPQMYQNNLNDYNNNNHNNNNNNNNQYYNRGENFNANSMMNHNQNPLMNQNNLNDYTNNNNNNSQYNNESANLNANHLMNKNLQPQINQNNPDNRNPMDAFKQPNPQQNNQNVYNPKLDSDSNAVGNNNRLIHNEMVNNSNPNFIMH